MKTLRMVAVYLLLWIVVQGSGIIHSPGIERLNFLGPSGLDAGSGVPDLVIDLLNEPITGSDFH